MWISECLVKSTWAEYNHHADVVIHNLVSSVVHACRKQSTVHVVRCVPDADDSVSSGGWRWRWLDWHWVVGSLRYTARLSCKQTCMTVCGYICRYAESFHRRSRETIRWHNDTPTVLSRDTTRHQVLLCIRKLSESQLNLAHGTE